MNNNHQTRVYDSVLGLLADEHNPTPMVRLNKVIPYKHTEVWVKLEWYNPFGANKDRVARNLIEEAEQRGELEPGKRMIEATSGNTGVGLAMLGNIKGYQLRTPLSAKVPLEKRTVLRFLGTQVEELNDSLCPAPGAPEGAIATAKSIAATQKEYVMLNQYENHDNLMAHYRTTGPEIWRQTEGRVTHFVAGLGTCGTITGTGRYLREKNENLTIVGAHPEEGHDIPGVRSLVQLGQTKLFFPDEYDHVVEVGNRESYDMSLRLNREEGIIAAPSSGMALMGALKVIPDEPGNVVVIIFPDNIFKYASSFQRHFPNECPADPSEESSGPNESDIFVQTMLENLKNPHDTIKVKDLSESMDSSETPVVVDVRGPDFYAQSRIDGSINIPLDDIKDRVKELPEDRDAAIVMVCGIGKFSKNSVLMLKSMGYRNVRSLKGGVNEWDRKGMPLVGTNGSGEANGSSNGHS
ncbi:MAG: pyridoxal-phosphate dependent enzyme [Phycisphaerae bacterium]